MRCRWRRGRSLVTLSSHFRSSEQRCFRFPLPCRANEYDWNRAATERTAMPACALRILSELSSFIIRSDTLISCHNKNRSTLKQGLGLGGCRWAGTEHNSRGLALAWPVMPVYPGCGSAWALASFERTYRPAVSAPSQPCRERHQQFPPARWRSQGLPHPKERRSRQGLHHQFQAARRQPSLGRPCVRSSRSTTA